MSSPDKPVTPERIMQMSSGYAPPLILEAALRNGVFDALDAGPKDLAGVAQATGASNRGLRAILNALVGLELLTRDSDGRYGLTPESSAFLVSSRPTFRGGMLTHVSRQLIPAWLHLDEAVRTGAPVASVNQEGEGAGFFEKFVEELFPNNYPAAKKLAEALDLGASGQPVTVLDLAAGSGVWGIAAAQSSPMVRVTAVDWPNVLPVTRKVVERHDLAGQFQYIAGDLKSANLGDGYKLAILGHILHSEGEADSRLVLRRTFDALAPGGVIAAAEFLVDADRRGPLRSLFFAVNMLLNTDRGDTWSFEEIRSWLLEAGFKDPRTFEAPAASPLILATKP